MILAAILVVCAALWMAGAVVVWLVALTAGLVALAYEVWLMRHG